MSFTRLQARSRYIIGSMALFLDRNVKAGYDAEVASLTFPTPLTVLLGKPDDKGIILKAPSIAISTITAPGRGAEIEVGSSMQWRHMNFVFHCFPALVNGEPNETAAQLLKSYMQDAFGTKYIKVGDYTNAAWNSPPGNLVWCNDVMEVVTALPPVDRRATTTLAEELHRFDMHVAVRYAVIETNAT